MQLPDYPPRNAGHMLQAKLSYLDAEWGSGLFYITQFVQGTGEQPDNERLTYIFQGLSKDGKFFISADFRIEHKLLRSFKKDADPDQVTEQVEAAFPRQPDDSFSPSLKAIQKWVLGLEFK